MAEHIRTTAFSMKEKNMKRRLIQTVLLAACAAAPLALTPVGTAHAQTITVPKHQIVLSIGRGDLVTVPGKMADVFVAQEGIADVQIKSDRQLYLFGKGGGETTVYASNAAGDIIWSANVRVGSNIESVDQMLRLAMPEAKITVSTMGSNTYLLTGTVAAPDDAAEAERLVTAYVSNGATGTNTANVISRLRTATPLQVNLQVRFAEVSRSLAREIGMNMMTRDNTGGFTFGISRGRNFGTITGSGVSKNLPLLDPSYRYSLPPGTLPPMPFDPVTGQFVSNSTQYTVNQLAGSTTIALAKHLAGLDISTALDLGERVGLVSTLSQPNLTALSGETAEFLAGGEYPIPVSSGLGTTSIEYKNYGVSLSYTPTVLANGRISIRVKPEVSELSAQGAIVSNGFSIPATTIRRAETTVELGSGQSFMIAGLLSSNAQHTLEKTPGAGDLPIIGSLFRSTSFQRGETELVIVVTPYLVNPVNASDIKLPTDGYRASNELQQLLLNSNSDGISGATRPGPTMSPDKAANPEVGMIEPEAQKTTGKTAKSGKADKGKQRNADAAPAPGFSLN